MSTWKTVSPGAVVWFEILRPYAAAQEIGSDTRPLLLPAVMFFQYLFAVTVVWTRLKSYLLTVKVRLMLYCVGMPSESTLAGKRQMVCPK
jgi:hypothetical protein